MSKQHQSFCSVLFYSMEPCRISFFSAQMYKISPSLPGSMVLACAQEPCSGQLPHAHICVLERSAQWHRRRLRTPRWQICLLQRYSLSQLKSWVVAVCFNHKIKRGKKTHKCTLWFRAERKRCKLSVSVFCHGTAWVMSSCSAPTVADDSGC